jgi:hypothetical protein
MVDVADGAHIHMRFRSLKLLLCHEYSSSSIGAQCICAQRLHLSYSTRLVLIPDPVFMLDTTKKIAIQNPVGRPSDFGSE